MIYSKTFYYQLAIVVDSDDKLTDIDEKEVLKHSIEILVGNKTIKIGEQEVILRPIAVDRLPKTPAQSFEDCVEKLGKIVERLDRGKVLDLLTDMRIWAEEAIKKYGAIDALGHLLQYLTELEENEL